MSPDVRAKFQPNPTFFAENGFLSSKNFKKINFKNIKKIVRFLTSDLNENWYPTNFNDAEEK